MMGRRWTKLTPVPGSLLVAVCALADDFACSDTCSLLQYPCSQTGQICSDGWAVGWVRSW